MKHLPSVENVKGACTCRAVISGWTVLAVRSQMHTIPSCLSPIRNFPSLETLIVPTLIGVVTGGFFVAIEIWAGCVPRYRRIVLPVATSQSEMVCVASCQEELTTSRVPLFEKRSAWMWCPFAGY